MPRKISTRTPWEPVAGYSRAVAAGDFVFVSGCTSVADGVFVHDGDAGAQTTQAIANVAQALERLGAGLADVVRTRMFVTDISRWEEYGRAHGAAFGDGDAGHLHGRGGGAGRPADAGRGRGGRLQARRRCLVPCWRSTSRRAADDALGVAVRVIPCLDVDAGRVVKGVNFADLRDAGDPVELAAAYDAEGADELVFLDITASSGGRETMYEVVSRTAEQVFIPLTVGGGVRSAEDVDRLLRAGADKVSLNTAAVARPELLAEAAQRFGSQCVVLSVDARRAQGGPPRRRPAGSR